VKASPAVAERGSTTNNLRTWNQTPAANRPLPTKIGVGEVNPGAATGNARAAEPAAPERGWQRFGSQEAQNRPPQNPPQNQRKPETAAPATQRQTQPVPRPPANEQGGWRRFSDNPVRTAPSAQPPQNRSERPAAPVNELPAVRNRTNDAPASPGGSPNRSEGWRQFTPEPRSAASEPSNRGGANGQFQRFPSASETRQRGSAGDFSRSSRPPLNLQRPIVTPRQSGGMSGGPSHGGGGYRPAPRSGGSAPHGGSGGSAPHGGSGGGGQPHSSGGRR